MVGLEGASDAGIYRLRDDLALVLTLDFFTPIVDDPYDFGQIAAANSLSDVYAMGGRPICALNVVCFPKDEDKKILKEILCGGLDKIHEAGAVLVGGHSVDDPEIKYGLSVTGIVHPERYLSNSKARPGDVLFLTKPLGTGVIITALKGGVASKKAVARAVAVMKTLNQAASEAMVEFALQAATDITGFGLAGHALEMAEASGVTVALYAQKVPILEEALEYLRLGLVPEGDYAIRRFCEKKIQIEGTPSRERLDLLFDAQTSGGLLIACPEEKAGKFLVRLLEKGVLEAAVVGEVLEGPPRLVIRP
ncbi:selenide,water dikinase [Thermosulfuriphilus ammonigenes]|nr:selenide,water dikinase [Thermosulfuriphilus ammonigenes]